MKGVRPGKENTRARVGKMQNMTLKLKLNTSIEREPERSRDSGLAQAKQRRLNTSLDEEIAGAWVRDREAVVKKRK
jgi:hypothetical protein